MENTTTINIYPVSKFKRFLGFLGDLLVHYIFSVFVLHSLVFPIASKITNYNSKLNENKTLINQRIDILYGNDLLFYDEKSKYNIDQNLDTTFDKFLKYYVTDKTDGFDPIKRYFCDIKNLDNQTMNKTYIQYGEPFFEIENNEVILKKDYQDFFAPYFDKNDTLSEVGKSYLASFRKGVFVSLFNYMVNDINQNDLVYKNSSYKKITDEITKNQKSTISFNSINILISFGVSYLIIYIVFPLIFKDHLTICEKILKFKRIKVNNYEYLNKKEYIFVALNNLFMSLSTSLFIGVVLIGPKEIFKYNFLMIISIISIIYVFVNCCVLIANPLNKTLEELSTHSIIISDENLNQIYEAKGYEK